MKLSDYARQQGVRYETAWRWFRDGKIKGRRIGPHTILVDEEPTTHLVPIQRVAIYARVSSAENKSNLDSQAERLVAYCTAKGYQVAKVVKEIGSGVNDARPKLLALLEDTSITLIVVEHASSVTEHRECFHLLLAALVASGRRIECTILSEDNPYAARTQCSSQRIKQ